MAKYILKNGSSFSKVASSEASKTFWENTFGLTSESCTDDQYNGLIRSTKSYDEGTWVDLTRDDVSFSLIELKEALEKHIKKVKTAIDNHENEPSSWATDLSTLEAIDLNSLIETAGVMPTITGKNWVDALMNNSISVPLVLEV